MVLCRYVREVGMSSILTRCKPGFTDFLGHRTVRISAPSAAFSEMAAISNAQKEAGRVQIYPEKTPEISNFWREKYEKDARKYWDIFYKRNENRFFKDRHYLDKEWGQYFISKDIGAGSVVVDAGSLSDERRRKILEVGCGVGNTVFPLIAQYPDLFVYACDFSPRAVDLVKAHEDYNESRVKAFICDATSDSLLETIPPASVDVITLVFMLSAVGPEKMPTVVRNLKSVLKRGGHILFRDYAVGDLAQERFMTKDQKISDNFYVRGDGTRAYYFSEDGLKKLFAEEGFECKQMLVHSRQLENRARKIKMDRRWIQCVFRLPDELPRLSSAEQQEAIIQVAEDLHESSKPNSAGPCENDQYGKSRCELGQALSDTLPSKELEEEQVVDLSEGFGAELFGGAPSPEPLEVVIGDYKVNAMCLRNENQHTFAATGFMLWDSALALATVLAKNTSLTQGQAVLELGCGSIGLCSLIASITAEKVVATDGDSGTLDLLRQNLALNRESFGVEKILQWKLQWGNMEEILALKAANANRGFDLIIGSDVTYVKEAVPLLFETVKFLLREPVIGRPEPQLLLCHRIRQVAESDILASAAAKGFCIKGLWTSDDIVVDDEERKKSPCIDLLFEGLEDIGINHNSLQLLLLTRSG